MIMAAVCPKCLQYRYRTAELPPDVPPTPEDFEPIAPQATLACNGQKAVCDTCGTDLKFVKGQDWDTLTRQASPPTNGHAATRISVAPAPVTEVFHVESDEKVLECRPVAGDRLLVVTSKRGFVIDPNLIGGQP